MRLTQFLAIKATTVSMSQSRRFVVSRIVKVNGVVETDMDRILVDGDQVEFNGNTYTYESKK